MLRVTIGGNNRIRYMEPSKTMLYKKLANLILAIHNCEKHGNAEWLANHSANMRQLVKDFMPSGSGIDSGTTLVLDECTEDKLVFQTSFHHMAESGMYDGWTEHRIVVTASLWSDINLRIGGQNRNEIKDYLHEVFHTALTTEV